jgi:AcrR family transcriptional regulator
MDAEKPRNPKDAIVDALMSLASDRPWDDIEITDICEAAGISLADFREHFPSKGAVLGAFSRRIDLEVLRGTTEDLAGEPVRERLFDVLMRRIDAMTPYKAALRRIRFALRGDLVAMAALNQVALNSMRFMLGAAGVSTEGPLGLLKLQGAVVAFSNTVETWLDDDDADLARTMARLDRELRRGERVMERAEDLRRVTAPLRAIVQAAFDGRDRVRRRGQDRTREPDDGSQPPRAYDPSI